MTGDLPAQVREALRVVIDPELGANIVDLGFVYDITVSNGAARITMTATTPGCPASSFLKEGVARSAAQVAGISSVEVLMIFEPAWNPSMMSAETKTSLGFAPIH
jgi:metal-sulfur cluster biosynthetic enzyme